MYGDNFSQFSIEGALFDKTKELGSLARALPGLSLSSVAFPQWPTKPVKSARTQQSWRCHRERKQHTEPTSPASSQTPRPSLSASFSPSLASPPLSPPTIRPTSQSQSYEPQHYEPQHYEPQHYEPQHYEPTRYDFKHYESKHYEARHFEPRQYEARQYEPRQYEPTPYEQVFEPQIYEPQLHDTNQYDSRFEQPRFGEQLKLKPTELPPVSPPHLQAWPPAPNMPKPTPVCDHAAHADLGWCSWDRWARGSMDSATSEGLTTSSTISDSVIEPVDDEVTLVSRPSSPRPAKAVRAVEARPPRPCLQPAKTGFALWVGNLSAHTTLMDLRDMFGTPEIQSIYLIQRTGCAFVNYSNGAALDAGIELFNRQNGKLHDHELVIKAQRADDDQQSAQAAPPPVNSPDRFFICKSLTVEDLETAKQKGLWSTQLRNRDKFNEAFNQAENVYLVFSANRTSAFYGFARLETPFGDDISQDDASDALDPASEDADSGFEITRTPATFNPEKKTYVPAGEIVLDPLRGSQFWKVDSCPYAESDTEKWAAPAKITWLSSPNNVVSFSRTRQLKNSLNQNKPVKVARDGTEIDPAVGRELCDMFH